MTPSEATHQLRDYANAFRYGAVFTESMLLDDLPLLFSTAEFALSQTELRKWSERIRERDGRCLMCDDQRNLESHHCYPKSLYPEWAYADNNGVSLCYRCHRVIVHGSDTWDLTTWRRFLPLFADWVYLPQVPM